MPVMLASDRERLSKLMEDERPMQLIDLVGSEASGSLFEAMPVNSKLIVAGNMSNARLSISTTEFFMHNKRISGFCFERHMAALDSDRRRELMRIVEEDINADGEYFGIRDCKEFAFEQWD